MAATFPPASSAPTSLENTSLYDYYYFENFPDTVCRKEAILSFGQVFLPIFYSLVFVLGLGGNLFFLIVLLYSARSRRVTEIYLLNLVVSNLLFTITLPFWGVSAAWHWGFGEVLCKIICTLYTTSLYGSIFFLGCMSLDKYLDVVHAQTHHRQWTSAKSRLLTGGVWTVALVLSIPDLVFARLQEGPSGRQNCHLDFGENGPVWKLVLRFQQSALGFILPLFTMAFFYTRIVCVLTVLRPRGRSRALWRAALLVVTFFALWGPYNITLFLHSLQDLQVLESCEVSKHLDYALQVTESIAFLHSCLSPFLYLFVHHRLKKHLKKVLEVIFKRCRESAAHPSQASYSNSYSTDQEEMTSTGNLEQSLQDHRI
ncbi:atypical chemokine receptor 2 [Monodelphis domestica]|nr:atypical chemokine receptor 2 [Monodelphis domestica]XP_016279840.1 atypical chemokine receptor 2 [Monodelphis domestica]XP_016279844.1 atypical chemokine receptor 2 [Monodelphis domestica]XP_016279846.1 atypical chemokine receptor 2 [Monodelphis domestica]XP_016279847.1 atypical chemokine receptor 2 [Monodelphis domestica]XP_056661084.1 atypical chemokine receptor 2 [Monodelphis domestica]XP_056661086.1 atypical chemokine receptor 2 [Monodelphis domestica]XP_056661087.1 atypical chemokin